MAITVNDILDPDFTWAIEGREILNGLAGWWYVIRDRQQGMYARHWHGGTRQQAVDDARRTVGRLNGRCDEAGQFNNETAPGRRRANLPKKAWAPGTALNTLTVLDVVQTVGRERAFEYRVKMACCGTEVTMTGGGISYREKSPPGNGRLVCRHCQWRAKEVAA